MRRESPIPLLRAVHNPYFVEAGIASVLLARSSETEGRSMNILFVVIAVIAIILAITGGLVHAVSFLLWVGIVLLILAVIAFLLRSISGRRRI